MKTKKFDQFIAKLEFAAIENLANVTGLGNLLSESLNLLEEFTHKKSVSVNTLRTLFQFKLSVTQICRAMQTKKKEMTGYRVLSSA